MIQYSAPPQLNLEGRSVLDAPPARGMTVSCKPHRRLQRRAAQKILRLHRRLAGALQFEDPQRAFLAGDREVIVEDIARHTRAIDHCATQDLDARRLAFDGYIAPRAGKPSLPMNMTNNRARSLVPV